MNSRWLIGSCLLLMLVAATIMWALCAALDSPSTPPVRLWFISGGVSEHWNRTVQGARDAASDLGIELQVRKPTADDSPQQQAAILRAIDVRECDGIAFCPADPDSQLEIVSEIAEQTKLVTIGNYNSRSKALCHVGFSPIGVANRIAGLIFSELTPGGKIALLTSHSGAGSDSLTLINLNDFKEQWNTWEKSGSSRLRSVALDVDRLGAITQKSSSVLSAALNAHDLAFVVAFDLPSAESALKVFAQHPRTPVPIIAAFDPTTAVLDAIEDGRVYAAISQDPYRIGYEGVVRTAKLCRSDGTSSLPAPGYGSEFIPAQTVQKSNLSDFRKRAQARLISANRPGCSAKSLESRAKINTLQSAEQS